MPTTRDPERGSDRQQDTSSFPRRVLVAAAIVAAVALGLGLAIRTFSVLLLIFAGILFAVFLRSLSDWVGARTRLPAAWSLAVVLLLLVGLVAAASIYVAPGVATQFAALAERLPHSLEQLQHYLEQSGWGRTLAVHLIGKGGIDTARVLDQVSGIFSTTLGALANTLIILFVGIYGAAEMPGYHRGVIKLVPGRSRQRAAMIMTELDLTLRWWLLGRVSAMASVGVLTSVGLWILGMPLVLGLGALAALLTFIPYIGAILSAVPAVLLALLQGPGMAIKIVLLYLAAHLIEGYVVTPLVQRRAVRLPPALTISVQVLLGYLAGGFGLMVATPLTAVGIVLVKRLYIEDLLGDEAADFPHGGLRRHTTRP